jgi:hypothetical protein
MSKTAPLLVLALVVAITACSDDPVPTDNRARVYFEKDSLITDESVFVTLNDGEKIWDFKPVNFQPSDTDTLLYLGPEVQTADAGSLLMEFSLFTPSDVLIASGTVRVPMSPNWRWSLGISHAATNTPIGCDDCFGSSAFEIEIPGHEDERIFVVMRGSGP